MKKILPFFSYLFHPIFISVYAAIYYFFCTYSYFTILEKSFVLFQIVILTILIPILFFFLLRAAGKIDSVMVAEISQRKIPLIIQCFLIILLIRKSVTIEQYPELHFFFLGGLLSTVSALVMLFLKIKTSLHMVGISALTIFIIGLSIHFQINSIPIIAFTVLMNGFVASSRLEMKAHTIKELSVGFFFGVIPQLILMNLWL